MGTVRGPAGARAGTGMGQGVEQGGSTHSSVFRSCARPARRGSGCSSSHWLSLLLRKSSRALMPRKLLALGYEPTVIGASAGGWGASGLLWGQDGEGSTSRGGASSWLPLMELAVGVEELLAFGCPGDKVLPLPRGEPCGGLLSASSLVDVVFGPSGIMTLEWKKYSIVNKSTHSNKCTDHDNKEDCES